MSLATAPDRYWDQLLSRRLGQAGAQQALRQETQNPQNLPRQPDLSVKCVQSGDPWAWFPVKVGGGKGFGRFNCPGGYAINKDCWCPRCAGLKADTVVMYGKRVNANSDLRDKYIVWCPTSLQPPQYVYDNRPDAIRAATALAHKDRGKRFAVCKIVGESAVTDVKYESYSE